MKGSRMNRRGSRRGSRRASRQNRKSRRQSRKQGGFVRGTSPILGASVFSGNSTWNKPGTAASAVLPVGPNGYRPFASSVQSTYRPFSQGALPAQPVRSVTPQPVRTMAPQPTVRRG